jgi:hypothetical protein
MIFMTKTNKELFTEVLTVIDNSSVTNKDELSAFIASRIELIDKKATTVTKAKQKKAEENSALAEVVLSGLQSANKPIKVSDLIKATEELKEYSTQKITPILSELVKQKKVEKMTLKRENFYSYVLL